MMIPIAKVSAIITSIFRLCPIPCTTAKVPMIEIGSEIAATIVIVKLRKNKNTIEVAKIAPKSKSNFTSSIDSWI